jgi:hypothetical protein
MTAIAHGHGRSASERLLRSAARGAVLIGVAVVIGIVLLQVVDNGSPVGSGQSSGSHTGGVTTTTKSGARNPQAVRVIVLNGSGLSGAAANLTNKLRGLGYVMGVPGNAATQSGTTVSCRSGFEKEAAILAGPNLAGSPVAATVTAFPNPEPPEAANEDCVITVGKSA